MQLGGIPTTYLTYLITRHITILEYTKNLYPLTYHDTCIWSQVVQVWSLRLAELE